MKRTNKENIDYLMVDEPFGILTRPALELYMSNWKRKSKIYIVDFNGIHKLNNQLGYCDAENLQCRAKLNHKAVMFDVSCEYYWFHLTDDEFSAIFEL
jgi:hypothetical protein